MEVLVDGAKWKRLIGPFSTVTSLLIKETKNWGKGSFMLLEFTTENSVAMVSVISMCLTI